VKYSQPQPTVSVLDDERQQIANKGLPHLEARREARHSPLGVKFANHSTDPNKRGHLSAIPEFVC